MKTFAFLASFIIGLINFFPLALATESINCSGIELSEVQSLGKLPTEVGALLGTGRLGSDGIADRGAKFNATDVILDEHLPWRRFSIAAVSASCVLVAVEHGGRGYYVEIWAFERNDGLWRGEQLRGIFNVPRTMKELMDSVVK